MHMNMTKRLIIVMCILACGLPVSALPAAPLPNPVLVSYGQQPFTRDGKQFIRYNYFVFNSDAYPLELFEPAPTLPPCGKNTNASRTWVDFFDSSGKRLNGFCAIDKAAGLNNIWFSLDAGTIPPSWIYIVIHDRQTDTKYRSNLADTTL